METNLAFLEPLFDICHIINKIQELEQYGFNEEIDASVKIWEIKLQKMAKQRNMTVEQVWNAYINLS